MLSDLLLTLQASGVLSGPWAPLPAPAEVSTALQPLGPGACQPAPDSAALQSLPSPGERTRLPAMPHASITLHPGEGAGAELLGAHQSTLNQASHPVARRSRSRAQGRGRGRDRAGAGPWQHAETRLEPAG